MDLVRLAFVNRCRLDHKQVRVELLLEKIEVFLAHLGGGVDRSGIKNSQNEALPRLAEASGRRVLTQRHGDTEVGEEEVGDMKGSEKLNGIIGEPDIADGNFTEPGP